MSKYHVPETLKKAREEGKTAFFSKPEPDKLFIDGRFVPL